MDFTKVKENKEKIYVCIDDIQYKEKPEKKDMGKISNRITNQVKLVKINELQQAICKGQTFCGTIFKQKNGIRERKQENFAMQKIFAIDVDEKHDEEINMDGRFLYDIVVSVVRRLFERRQVFLRHDVC